MRSAFLFLVLGSAISASSCGADIERLGTGGGGAAEGGTGGGSNPGTTITTGPPPDGENDRCATPLPIDLTDDVEVIEDDTTLADDEHSELTCDSQHVAHSFDQGQLYYAFTAQAGRTYHFELTSAFYGFVYVFPRSIGCSFEAIEAACSSDGSNGMISGIVNPKTTGQSSFTATASTEYVLAVDGDTSEGPFTLVVEVE